MEGNRRIHHIVIKNADVWAAGWITYYMYKFVDVGEIESVEVEQVRKSDESIDLIIKFFVAAYSIYHAAKDLKEARDAVTKVGEMLRRWKAKRKQKKIDIFLDGEQIQS